MPRPGRHGSRRCPPRGAGGGGRAGPAAAGEAAEPGQLLTFLNQLNPADPVDRCTKCEGIRLWSTVLDMVALRRQLATTRLAPLVALPVRVRSVGGYDVQVMRASIKWLVRSREHTNYTYELTDLNMGQLAWFVANLTGCDVDAVRGFMDELRSDEELAEHIVSSTLSSDRRGLADPVPRYGRRLGWYAIVRALEPELVVETGTDKGLGSVVLAAALLRNGHGRLTTIDLNPAAGYLIGGPWGDVVDYAHGDSHAVLRDIERPIDVFVHDSLHTVAHESAEYRLIEPNLTERSIVLSDNADVDPTLMKWAESRGWRFQFFQEVPSDHWCPGGGIGAARCTPRAPSG